MVLQGMVISDSTLPRLGATSGNLSACTWAVAAPVAAGSEGVHCVRSSFEHVQTIPMAGLCHAGALASIVCRGRMNRRRGCSRGRLQPACNAKRSRNTHPQQRLCSRLAAADLKGQHAAAAAAELLLRERVEARARQAGVGHPLDLPQTQESLTKRPSYSPPHAPFSSYLDATDGARMHQHPQHSL